ncbi:hypothetical protein D3C71_1632070 [compost metagenome]
MKERQQFGIGGAWRRSVASRGRSCETWLVSQRRVWDEKLPCFEAKRTRDFFNVADAGARLGIAHAADRGLCDATREPLFQGDVGKASFVHQTIEVSADYFGRRLFTHKWNYAPACGPFAG